MNTLFAALLMLCGLSSVSFLTTAATRREMFLALVPAIVIAAAGITPDALPDARWIGGVAAAVAAIQVFRPHTRWIGPLYGGILAGILGLLMRAQGVPISIAVPLALALPFVSAYLSIRNSGFAPDALRQEAMLATIALGLAVAVIPGIISGWQSALALNRDEGSSNQIIANWVLVLSGASVVLGGLYSLLRRR